MKGDIKMVVIMIKVAAGSMSLAGIAVLLVSLI